MTKCDHFLYLPTMKRQESEEMLSAGKAAYDRYVNALWNQEALEDYPHKGYRVVHAELVYYEHGREFMEFSLIKGGHDIHVGIELPR